MVVFTCQHCGDPVKKPSVEKHYNTRCRNRSPHLTCVDCLKDFGCDDYNSHNQCMTEAQRYSAQGTVFKEQKGKKKQELYVEMIQTILNSNVNLSHVQRQLLEICSNFDNVPRKPKPFKNFMLNVARSIKYTENDINTVFNVIENAWKKETQPGSALPEKKNQHQIKETNHSQETTVSNITIQNKTDAEFTNDKAKSDKCKKSKNKNQSESSLVSDRVFDHEATKETSFKENENENNFKPKKTKKKIHNDNSLEMNENCDEENILSPNRIIKEGANKILNCEPKDKHKRKSICLDYDNARDPDLKDVSNNENDTKENTNSLTKKQLKKQKKYEKYLKELENESKTKGNNENCLNGEDEESNNTKKTKKKNKKLKQENNDSEFHGLTEDKIDVNPNEIPKISKKRKLEEIADEAPGKKIKENTEEAFATAAAAFSWGDVILRVLNSQPDKELSLKKLGKKVVKEYQTTKQDHRTYEELLHKFNKKVIKVKGVRVLRDRAKLIE